MFNYSVIENEIANQLNQYHHFSEINDFFEFILAKITCKNDKLLMTELLTKMSTNIDNEIHYDIVTDTLDYLTGFYGPLNKNSQAYAFVEKLLRFD